LGVVEMLCERLGKLASGLLSLMWWCRNRQSTRARQKNTQGGPMAANLLRAGLPVLVFDRNPAAVEKLTRLGAKAASSPQEVGSTPGKEAGAGGGGGGGGRIIGNYQVKGFGFVLF